MALQPLSQNEFLTRLGDLFSHRKGHDHGAIYLTQKRLTYGQSPPSSTTDNPLADIGLDQPMPVIIRASDGKSKGSKDGKVKFSTIVHPHELNEFYGRYAEVCKAGMSALKPRDRSKKKAKARRKKAML